MPKVSVIIPTYNRAGFLHSAIESALNQTFQDFEIIIVDDASKDDTHRVVKAFHNRKIRYLRHERNQGEAGTRNTGLRMARGKYIAFLDDDDEWLPEKLRLQMEKLSSSRPKVGLIYSGLIAVRSMSREVLHQRRPDKRGNVYREMLASNLIGTPSIVLLKKSCIDKVGLFDSGIAYGLDYDLWIRISRYFHFDFIDDFVVRYTIHDQRLSNNPEIRIRGIEDMARKYGKGMILRNDFFRASYLSVGVQFCFNGEIGKGRKALLKSIIVDPFELRNYFNLGISFLGADNFRKIKSFKNRIIAPFRA